jgi:uncharacterized Fe-S cluster-containing radical SAM superfamily enzyme
MLQYVGDVELFDGTIGIIFSENNLEYLNDEKIEKIKNFSIDRENIEVDIKSDKNKKMMFIQINGPKNKKTELSHFKDYYNNLK